MKAKDTDRLYSDEISLSAEVEYLEYVSLNLRKIKEYREAFKIPVIGITGAEGKTTTKRMLSTILSSIGKVLETPLDCSTTSGVTSTLLKLDESFDFVVLELGILNQKQFELAVKVSQPNMGVVTNIGEAHLATLGDKYLIADAKLELIRNLPADGFAVLNKDDDLVSEMEKFSPTSRIVKFGLNNSAHFFANRIKYKGPEGILFHVNDYYPFHLAIYGSASIYNALAAISVARLLGVSFEDIKRSLEENFTHLKHRGNLIEIGDVYLLDHTYDSTINSLTKACESLVQFKPYSKKLILVVGDIAHPGANPIATHLNMGYYISALPIDTVITIGELAKYVAEGVRKINYTKKHIEICNDVDGLVEQVLKHVVPGTTMLITGKKDLRLAEPLDKIIQSLEGK